MRIHIQRDKFVPLFTLISNFTSTNDLYPARQNVKLIANESTVVLMATDGEISARGEIAVDESFVIDRVGEALLPAKLLGKIFSETTDSDILLDIEGTRLTVKGAKFRYQLGIIEDVASFPTVAPFQGVDCFKLSVASLNRMISRTIYATEANNTHFELRGVMFLFEQERTTAVATDGRRLALQVCSSEYVANGEEHEFEAKKAIFPTRALNLIKRSSSAASDALIAVRDVNAQIQIGNVVISTTLNSGRFPDWKAILPDKTKKKYVDFIVEELARAVRQADIVLTQDKPGLEFYFETGKVSVTAAGEATGESSVELPIAYDGEPEKLRFDSRFLNEFFREAPADDTVRFYFSVLGDQKSDYRALFETNDGYQYVVMQLS